MNARKDTEVIAKGNKWLILLHNQYYKLEFKDVSVQKFNNKRISCFYHYLVIYETHRNYCLPEAGQETRPFDTFRNVHEADIASMNCTKEYANQRRKCVLFPLWCLHFLPQFMDRKLQEQHTTLRLSGVPYSTRTSLNRPPDAASGLVTMAGTKGSGRMFFGGMRAVFFTLFP